MEAWKLAASPLGTYINLRRPLVLNSMYRYIPSDSTILHYLYHHVRYDTSELSQFTHTYPSTLEMRGSSLITYIGRYRQVALHVIKSSLPFKPPSAPFPFSPDPSSLSTFTPRSRSPTTGTSYHTLAATLPLSPDSTSRSTPPRPFS